MDDATVRRQNTAFRAIGFSLGCCAVVAVVVALMLRREPTKELTTNPPSAGQLALESLKVIDPSLAERLGMPTTEAAFPENVSERLRMPTPEDSMPERLRMPTLERVGFRPRNLQTEAELLRTLAGAEEVGLGVAGRNAYRNYVAQMRDTERRATNKGLADATHILRLDPKHAWLPLREGPSRVLSGKAAAELGVLSRKMRVYLEALVPHGPDGQPRDAKLLRDRMRADLRGKKPEWLRAAAVPALNQTLMGQDAPTRLLLVELLAEIPERPATLALAQRAAFDLSFEVRAAATEALVGRDPEIWRPKLIEALRYPWAPPAEFAAEALVRLKDAGAVPELIALLDAPEPGRPVTLADKRVVVREVVKIHHERNCLLCHVPSLGGEVLVGRVDPTWLTNGLSTDPELTAAIRRATPPAKPSKYAPKKPSVGSPILVRADVLFMRQDFSVSFPVVVERTALAKRLIDEAPEVARAAGLMPGPVRFDYVVRSRPVQRGEQEKWRSRPSETNKQREAALYALRGLTRQDHGDSTLVWEKAFPEARRELRARELTARLVRAGSLEWGAILGRYGESAGAEYLMAVSRAVPKLQGPAREAARLSLATRLAKAKSDERRGHLRGDDAELRRAAATACGRAGDRAAAADLVALLGDAVAGAAAREALEKLSGERRPDAESWRAWLTGATR